MELPVVTPNPIRSEDIDSMGKQNRLVSNDSTLLSMGLFEQTKEPLSFSLRSHQSADILLGIMGVMWGREYCSPALNALQIFWTLLLRFILALSVPGLVWYASFATNWSFMRRLLLLCNVITLILQIVTLAFSVRDIDKRLANKCPSLLPQHLRSGVCTSWGVFAVSLAIGVLPWFAMVQDNPGVISYYIISQLAVSCLLTAVMFFIIADCSAALSLVREMEELRRLKLLTVEQFQLVRSTIETTHAESYWVNSAIVVVALLDIFMVLLFILTGVDAYDEFNLLFYITFFMKEVPFVAVVYWKVSQVNELSAAFLVNLADDTWPGDEVNRHSIFVKAQGRPITYSLAGMKLTRRQLLLQSLAWCAAFVIGVVKSAAEARA